MDVEDALLFIVDSLRSNRPCGQYGYDVYVPAVICNYLKEIGFDDPWGSKEMREAAPVFLSASWELCRRGILRPGVVTWDAQATHDGSAGHGYSITPFGNLWLSEPEKDIYVPTEPERFARLLSEYKDIFQPSFHQRAQEAVRCYDAHAYIACCAMCGGAAESIFLTVAIAKLKNEEEVLKTYLSANGRSRVEKQVIGQAKERLKREFSGFTTLLKYWRDSSAHGSAVSISDNEAYTSIALLLRYAAFIKDNWKDLT